MGCPNGIDWSVMHEGALVKLITETGKQTNVSIDDYKKEVCLFVDRIEDFYSKCTQKILPNDELDRNGYIAFWNEWQRRRKQA